MMLGHNKYEDEQLEQFRKWWKEADRFVFDNHVDKDDALAIHEEGFCAALKTLGITGIRARVIEVNLEPHTLLDGEPLCPFEHEPDDGRSECSPMISDVMFCVGMTPNRNRCKLKNGAILVRAKERVT